jgi:transformation/transcription domain-associated protein
MNWELIRQKLTGEDVTQSLEAAQELLRTIDTVHVSEYPLLLSALLPACSSVLGTLHNTNTNNMIQQDMENDRLRRATLLEWMGKLLNGSKEALRPHATHVVAVAHGVLIADSEENAVLASRLLFDLYKTYRNLPCDYVQPYLDFVIALYRNLPAAVQRNFTPATLLGTISTAQPPTGAEHPTTMTTTDQAKPIASSTPTSEEKAIPVPMETSSLVATDLQPTVPTDTADIEGKHVSETPGTTTTPITSAAMTTTTQPSTGTSPQAKSTAAVSATPSSTINIQQPLKSIASFRVLTECPLIVMLLFQLYPKFMKNNIPSLIKVMMDALALRPPTLSSVLMAQGTQPTTTTTTTTPNNNNEDSIKKIDPALKRAYHARVRELIAAQAKTLSFLTYLLRTFGNELKPYENALATNVVALMSHCPRECLSTRKELLVATRHLLNHADFRGGFYRHIDAMLDERVLMGSTSTGGGSSSQQQRLSSTSVTIDPTLIRPLAYTTLADFVHHVRHLLTIAQVSRVVGVFSRILHDDTSLSLPLSTQYAAVRTLLSVVDLIFRDKDADPQLGRDMLVRMLDTLVDKLQALVEYFPVVLRAEIIRREDEIADRNTWMTKAAACQSTKSSSSLSTSTKLEALKMTTPNLLLRTHPIPADSVRDVQSMIRAIIVGNKTVIHYIARYRNQRAEMLAAEARENGTPPPQPASLLPPPGSNEEVASAMLKMTHTETAIVDRYIVTAIQAMKLLTEEGIRSVENIYKCTSPLSATESLGIAGDKTLADQHRDALSYFAAAFVAVDAITLRRTLGRRLDILVDAIVDDSTVMVVPRHILASDKTTSYEFCTILLEFLVERMDTLSLPCDTDIIFLEEQCSKPGSVKRSIGDQLHRTAQLPSESKERQRQRNITFLQLFERVLKSLSSFPDNEAAVRRHLRRITTVCLRNSMENIEEWPESYCMLLRYVFRSISAGKFEESYKELLPLIPTVLNGLYRVLTASEDVIIRCTAIELCLTIPARLSSLLPHMNLLLRMIIPALDSNVGDLVNLGYA